MTLNLANTLNRGLKRLPGYRRSRLAPLLFVTLLSACAEPYVVPPNGNHALPRLTQQYALMEDGYRLPLRRWQAVGSTRAIVLAVHGLNDYSFAFDSLGRHLSQHGITVIAYDQRGFGTSAGRGLWHGSERLSKDLVTVSTLLRAQNNEIPLFLIGESMGGAVLLNSLATTPLDVAGAVLLAPAVWTRDSMPFYQRLALWMAAHTMPGKQLTGKGLDLKPSDNTEMLRALSRDELVIKATRVDVLYGVSNLMDSAMLSADDVPGNILFLYGKHDDIIPAPPTCSLHQRLSSVNTTRLTAILYEHGYHMLTRDLQAKVVLEDIVTWMTGGDRVAYPDSDMQAYCAVQNGTEG